MSPPSLRNSCLAWPRAIAEARSLIAKTLAIDVGGTKIAAGMVGSDGSVSSRAEILTKAGDGSERVLERTVQLADRVAKEAGTPAEMVSLAIAELVDIEGRIRSSQTLRWEADDVHASLSHIAPVMITSDVVAGGFAEVRLGPGAGRTPVLYVSVGTGISSAIYVAGELLKGHHGYANLLASGPIAIPSDSGELLEAVPEQIASGAAICRRFNELAGTETEGAEDVFGFANAGDERAERVIRDAALMLATVIGFAINLIDPEVVVVGGGLRLALGCENDLFRDRLADVIWIEEVKSTPVLPASFGSDSALIGAGLAAICSVRAI